VSPTPDAIGLGVELLPADDDAVSPADALKAAAASAVDEPTGEVVPEPPQPLGMSWAFDWDRGRFIRQGNAPAEVRGLDALREWCLMTVNSARFAHTVFSDEFGVDRPDDLIGELDVDEMVSDFEERIREALLVHDRIAGVEDFEADWDPETGILTISEFDVLTDDDMPLDLSGVQLHTRGTA
jgi:hypothetical protein